MAEMLALSDHEFKTAIINMLRALMEKVEFEERVRKSAF